MRATATAPSIPPADRREQILAPWLIVALAALAVPRVVAHDLRLVEPGGIVNALLVFVPPIIWLGVVLWRRTARPFLTVLLIGLCYGIMLAIGHQLLWSAAFGDNPPRLGGAFGQVDPIVENLAVRAAAFISSILTGTFVGVLVGAVAAGLAQVQRRLVPSRT